jgi:SAM-dependent methyltransferase
MKYNDIDIMIGFYIALLVVVINYFVDMLVSDNAGLVTGGRNAGLVSDNAGLVNGGRSAGLVSDNTGLVTGGKGSRVSPLVSKRELDIIKSKTRRLGMRYINDYWKMLFKLYNQSSATKWGNGTPRHNLSDNVISLISTGEKKAKYIDYGCGSGNMTQYLSELIRADQVYCVDVNDFRTDKKSSVLIINSSEKTMLETFEPSSISFISAMNSIHHSKHGRSRVLGDMCSLLKPSCLLLIREHDVKSQDDLKCVILEHMIYDLIELQDKTMNMSDLKQWVKAYQTNHGGYYFSRDDLHNDLKDTMNMMLFEYKIGKNNSRIYTTIYKKKDNPSQSQ